MIRAKHLHYDKNGEPRLTIVVEGVHDIYRFANHLQRGQCEFADIGFNVERRLARRLGKARFRWLKRYMHGDGGFR